MVHPRIYNKQACHSEKLLLSQLYNQRMKMFIDFYELHAKSRRSRQNDRVEEPCSYQGQENLSKVILESLRL